MSPRHLRLGALLAVLQSLSGVEADYVLYSGKICSPKTDASATPFNDAVSNCDADSTCGGFNYRRPGVECTAGDTWCGQPQYFTLSSTGANCDNNAGWGAWVKPAATTTLTVTATTSTATTSTLTTVTTVTTATTTTLTATTTTTVTTATTTATTMTMTETTATTTVTSLVPAIQCSCQCFGAISEQPLVGGELLPGDTFSVAHFALSFSLGMEYAGVADAKLTATCAQEAPCRQYLPPTAVGAVNLNAQCSAERLSR